MSGAQGRESEFTQSAKMKTDFFVTSTRDYELSSKAGDTLRLSAQDPSEQKEAPNERLRMEEPSDEESPRDELEAAKEKHRKDRLRLAWLWENLEAKRREVLERMKKFQKFIDQNNTKRTRAESLMAAEQQAINQANEEQERCDKQVRRLEQKAEKLRVSLSLLQKYEGYLGRVLSALPRDYLDSPEPTIGNVIQRMRTLSDTQSHLTAELQRRDAEVQTLQRSVFVLEKKRANRVLALHSDLQNAQETLETVRARVVELTRNVSDKQLMELDKIRMIRCAETTIENIARKCEGHARKRQTQTSVTNVSQSRAKKGEKRSESGGQSVTEARLVLIRNRIVDLQGILKEFVQ